MSDIYLSRKEELENTIEWYRNNFPDWADSDCVVMAQRDIEAE
jgi:hypothetical protein